MENTSIVLEPKVAESVTFLSAFQGTSLPTPKISELKGKFLDYIQFEKGHAKQTIQKYEDCLRCFVKTVGDLPVTTLAIEHVIELRKRLTHRGVGDARIASVIFALKSFLRYCQDVLNVACLDSSKIKSPKRPKREVVYLTNEEVEQFVGSIKLYTCWECKKRKKRISVRGLRFRTLVEVLLGTGMRISEALSLNIGDVNFENGEATIIGKGNKQRTVFFNKRALWWIRKYLATRSDKCNALFVTHPYADRLKRPDIWRLFDYHTRKSGIHKRVTAHTLRHTFATNLIHNGCDLVTIKELLGHHDIAITVRSYIGVDKRKIRENHLKYLQYGDAVDDNQMS